MARVGFDTRVGPSTPWVHPGSPAGLAMPMRADRCAAVPVVPRPPWIAASTRSLAAATTALAWVRSIRSYCLVMFWNLNVTLSSSSNGDMVDPSHRAPARNDWTLMSFEPTSG